MDLDPDALREAVARTGDRELIAWSETDPLVAPLRLPGLRLPAWRFGPGAASHPLAIAVVALADGTLTVPSADPAGLHAVMREDPEAFLGPDGPGSLLALAGPTLHDWQLADVVEPLRLTEGGFAGELLVEDGAHRRLAVVLRPPHHLDATVLEGLLT